MLLQSPLFLFFCLLVISSMLAFRYRAAIAPHVPERLRSLFQRGPGNYYTPLSFQEQAEAGMSSSAFDLSGNLEGDSRMGLDDRGVQEVNEIMRNERVNFDQARLIRHNRMLASHGIDPSGMPLDSKAVTRL
ncbi:hypothetical protein DL96DRAFT_1583468 [Flagelloscypha sp. PMI_526]|nr:hypothetical protein DL96DRAFT_1583468 [Flagelloscypha sp. PMI_526]